MTFGGDRFRNSNNIKGIYYLNNLRGYNVDTTDVNDLRGYSYRNKVS
jgi:hypothetical protein